MTTLTTTLRAAIERDGRSVYRLCKDAGIDQASLSRFISGERGLTLESADKLAAALRLKLQPLPRARQSAQ